MALVNPNIAMSFRQPEFTPRNALAEYAQIQQIQGGQRQAEVADLQLQRMRQKEKAIGQIQARAAQGGGPTDRRAIAKAYLESGDPEFMQFGLKMETTLDELDAFNRIMGGGAAPTSAPNAMAAPDMPSSAPGAMAAPAELAAGAQPEPMAPVPGVISTSRVPGVTTAPITPPAGVMREIAPGGRMGAEMPLAPLEAPAASPSEPYPGYNASIGMPTPSANALAPTPAPSTNALMPKGVAPADPVAALRTKRDQLIAVGTPRALQAARSIDSDIALRSKTIAAPSEIGKLEAEIAALIQNGAKPDDPGIVARRGKISQLSGARAPTQLSRLIAERDALPPNSPVRAQYDAAIKKETTQAPGVTVTNVQERAESGAYGKMLVDQFGDISKQASVAARTLPSIDANLALLNKGLDTGFGTDAKAAGARVLGALGVQNAEKYATDTQTFQANAISAVLQKQLEQKGVQTDQDAKRIEQIGAQLGKTKAANEFILSVAKEQLKRDIEQRNFYTNWKSGPGKGSFDGAENAWFSGEGGKSLFDRPALKKYGVTGPATSAASQIPTGATPARAAPAPAATPPLPQGFTLDKK
jgi:hypothetical protein